MGIAEITQGHGFKNFMKYLYGWGAAVVIIGALFKLTHFPGANIMLTAGLSVEAIIFFFSAFEPLHEEVDWTLAYPELAGLTDDIDVEIDKKPKKVETSSGEALDKFNKMIEQAGDTNVFEKFGNGIQALNGKVEQMSDISDASLATEEYAQSMKNATSAVNTFNEEYKTSSTSVTDAVSGLADSYKQSVETVSYSTDSLSDALSKVSGVVSESGEEFTSAYKKLTDSMEVDFSALNDGNSDYNEHIDKLNKNLAALNAIFELQLNEADLDKMMDDLQGSVAHSKKYNEEITKLGQKLEALNNVYGNMLTAMNVNMND